MFILNNIFNFPLLSPAYILTIFVLNLEYYNENINKV